MAKVQIRKDDYTPDKDAVDKRIKKVLNDLSVSKFEELDEVFGDRTIVTILNEIDLTWPDDWLGIPTGKGVVAEISDNSVYGINIQFGLVDALEIAFEQFWQNWDGGVDSQAWLVDFRARLDATEAAIFRIREKLEEVE